MKQISVTVAMLFTLCLLLQWVVSVDMEQAGMNRPTAFAKLDEFSAQSRQETCVRASACSPAAGCLGISAPYEYAGRDPVRCGNASTGTRRNIVRAAQS